MTQPTQEQRHEIYEIAQSSRSSSDWADALINITWQKSKEDCLTQSEINEVYDKLPRNVQAFKFLLDEKIKQKLQSLQQPHQEEKTNGKEC